MHGWKDIAAVKLFITVDYGIGMTYTIGALNVLKHISVRYEQKAVKRN